MMTANQINAVRAHVALDEHTKSLIRLATHDLYEGPIDADSLGEEHEWPGFCTAVEMIADAMPEGDLYLDTIFDDVSDSEPEEMHAAIVVLDKRAVVRALVGRELAQYV